MTDDEAIDLNHTAMGRFGADDRFRGRVILAADVTRRMVELMDLSQCGRDHTLDYRRAAAIALAGETP